MRLPLFDEKNIVRFVLADIWNLIYKGQFDTLIILNKIIISMWQKNNNSEEKIRQYLHMLHGQLEGMELRLYTIPVIILARTIPFVRSLGSVPADMVKVSL